MSDATNKPLAHGLDRDAVARVLMQAKTGALADMILGLPDAQARGLQILTDAILSALAAPADGYVLVPVEPTEAMTEAGRDAAQSASAHYVSWTDAAQSAWSAMIAAYLPAAPTDGAR